MPILRYFTYWELPDLLGRLHKGGSLSDPVEIEVAGYVDNDTVSLATATTLTLWNSAEALTDFDFFYLKADQALYVEITCDRGGEVGLEELAFVLPAGRPLILPDDGALALYTSNFATGTADVIDSIRVRNVSGSTATIERAVIT